MVVSMRSGYEVGGNGVHPQTQKIFNLAAEDDDGDSRSKSSRDGMGNKLDEGSKATQSHQNEEHAGHERGNDQALVTEIRNDPRDNHDERAGWSANLYPAAA